MIIRIGDIEDLIEMQQLFVETIKNICNTDYDKEQINVWSSGIDDKQRWQDILTKQFVLIAQENNKITGFCTLDNGNYIDLFYVHKNHQRKGIAHKLYIDIEKEARRQKQTELTSNVSKTARPFFERMKFKVIRQQTFNVKGIELRNYKMIKALTE